MCIMFIIKKILNLFFGNFTGYTTNKSAPPCKNKEISTNVSRTAVDKESKFSNNIKWSISRILDDQMLSDNEIYESLLVLKEQFKHKTNLKGLFDPQLFNARFFKNNESKICINPEDMFIQIFHDGQLHWYVISNFNSANDLQIQIYDSYFMKKTYEYNKQFLSNVKKLISRNKSTGIKNESNLIECEIKSVQIQSDSKMCGVFAIAFAYDLCNGIDPATQNYDEYAMRKHLFECLKQRKFTEFPKSQISFLKTNQLEKIYISI
jgi:hypothetical protein